MKIILKFTFSLVLFFTGMSNSNAQNWYVPNSIRVGADLAGVGYSFFAPSRTHYEFHGDIAFNNFMPALSFGSSGFSRKTGELNYSSSGKFIRLGLDYNFFGNDKAGNIMFAGLRFSNSSSSEQSSLAIKNNFWGNQILNTTNQGVNARWFEITAGMKVDVWQNFFLGYTLRYMFGRKVSNIDLVAPYYLSGYGLASRSFNYGVNYFIYYRIPFKKEVKTDKI